MSLFSERMGTRQRVWWASVNEWRKQGVRVLVHRLRDTHRLRHRDTPDADWHCCELWQRSLNNKWNSREFAQRHGFRVPELYWHGRFVRSLPFKSLPAHYVIRPAWGAVRQGVHVMAHGRDLLHERTYDDRELKAAVQRRQGSFPRFPVLVEEFVKSETGEYVLPVEYKCFMFGTTVAAIQVVHRTGLAARHRFYTASWQDFPDEMSTALPLAPRSDPPRAVDQILACARALGSAYGTFVRVDCYASDQGCVFGEFSSTPSQGMTFTALANEYLGGHWDAAFPDRT